MAELEAFQDPQCRSGGVHTRYGQEETTIPGGCRRRGEKHDESYQGHDGGNDTDKASDRVLVTKVGGRHREYKGAANGGTLMSCDRAAVYPKPWTMDGVKLQIRLE